MKKYLAFGLAAALLALAGGLIALNSAKASAAKASEPAATIDTDNVQSGDQTSPDVIPAASAAKALAQPAQAAETQQPETESATESTVDQPGDAQLAGGGHQDPAGANVDHQFDGVE